MDCHCYIHMRMNKPSVTILLKANEQYFHGIVWFVHGVVLTFQSAVQCNQRTFQKKNFKKFSKISKCSVCS